MVIQTLFPGAAAAAPGTQLGAIDLSLPLAAGKALSVKKYSNGWASYQSPSANGVLTALNTDLGSLGFPSTYDGVVTARTLESIKTLAGIALIGGYASIPLPSSPGLRVGNAGIALRKYSTAEMIAKGGVEVQFYTRALASSPDFRAITKAILKGQPPPASTTTVTSPTNPSVPVTFPTGGGSGPVTLDPTAYASPGPTPAPKWPWYVAGGILAAGLVTTAVIVWR